MDKNKKILVVNACTYNQVLKAKTIATCLIYNGEPGKTYDNVSRNNGGVETKL